MPNQNWDISRLSPGERNALKRNAGIMMNVASMKAISAFYHAQIAKCKPAHEPFWFAAMCMRCLWQETENSHSKSFPEMLRMVYQDKNATESSQKKCVAFLDFIWNDDGFLLGKICALARRMRADHPNMPPDFESLADDLKQWNCEDRRIQRKWLSIICGNRDDFQEEERNRVD